MGLGRRDQGWSERWVEDGVLIDFSTNFQDYFTPSHSVVL